MQKTAGLEGRRFFVQIFLSLEVREHRARIRNLEWV